MGASLSFPTVDLSGKVAVVTGGNAGIGYETAKAIAVMGAHTIIACRSEERATAAVERMKQEVKSELQPDKEITVEFMRLDLASFQSTKDFIRAFKEKNLPLNILINNAGLVWPPFRNTDDGFESQLQVNHLSHFLLTLELLPTILDSAAATGDARIVFVSSTAHKSAVWNPENLNYELEGFDRYRSYGNTKLYNVLTAYALQRRLQNVGVTVSSLHPGVLVKTEAARNFEDMRAVWVAAKFGLPLFGRSAKDGAATTINAAVNPTLNSQQAVYYSDCQPKVSSVNSRNKQYQEELWRRTIDYLREHLSPEILENYGASQTQPATVPSPAGTQEPVPTTESSATQADPEPTESSATQADPEPTESSATQADPEPTETSATQADPEPTESSATQADPEPTESSATQADPEPTESSATQADPEPTETSATQADPEPTESSATQADPEPTESSATQANPEPTVSH